MCCSPSLYFSVSTDEGLEKNGGDIKHCHDNSLAQESREQEKKQARKRLYVVSVICLVFMIGEILGERMTHTQSS